MEKINALIDKLQELKNSAAGLQTISYYTQLLQAEILHQRNLQKQQELKGNGHVAVIMPAHVPVVERQAAPPPVPPPQEMPAPEKSQPPVQEKVLQSNGYAPDRVPVKPSRPEERPSATLFDPPPPVQPKPAEPPQPRQPAEHTNGIRKELNELVGKQAAPSLNDRLRKDNLEVGEKLGGIGVKDLRGAIGINDKFQFIQELFRGDKDMYERSLKTINESTSLQDAEYWIERELKIKLGWDESDQAVRQFYTLVRKRFS